MSYPYVPTCQRTRCHIMKIVKLKYPRLLGFVILMLASLGLGSLLATHGFSLLLVVLAGMLLVHYSRPSLVGWVLFICFIVAPVVVLGVIAFSFFEFSRALRGFRDPYEIIFIWAAAATGVAVLIGFVTQVLRVGNEDGQ
ncbi:hypothetical protein [Herbaspirillum frisingense]|nr:hypothetical protein [Herbaspirillum frisingense]